MSLSYFGGHFKRSVPDMKVEKLRRRPKSPSLELAPTSDKYSQLKCDNKIHFCL